ncbi:class I SAM-dependent methyltransferase [Hydrogenophaga sp. PAMC20947]|uniref:class I SAM-dependent methyltransferase n=1 Tax=Hydrogenophaga sp. PAMC20947 TaxID=2565558 RepID=UPI001FF71938|nr:class I SAM-dependent methyltransferase [Hydrogenophaga sp. PAMC20947]
MNESLKGTTRAQWDRAAPGWNAHGSLIGAWLARATEGMLGMAGIGPGSQVLDVAAGAGEQTMTIARRVGPTGRVLATDLSPVILALAEDNAQSAGWAHVRTQVADGEDLQVEPASFDAVVCRLGLMFFGDPLCGLIEMHRALRPGGRICTMVFSQPEHNPCITALMSIATKHAGFPAPDPYTQGGLLSLGRPGLIDAQFSAAGFRDVATTRVDAPFRMPSVRAYLDLVRTSASPIQQILCHLDEAGRARAWADMEEALSHYATPWGWEGPNELLLTAGRR